MAEREIPIEVKLQLKQIPPDIAGVLDTIGQKLGKLGRVEAELGAAIESVVPRAKRKKRSLEELLEAAGGYHRESIRLTAVIAKTRDTQKQLLPVIEQSKRTMEAHRAAVYMTARSFGVTGMAIRSLIREFFWLGLGTMFITMAWARMRRQTFAIERSMYSVRVAYRAVQRANKELREAMWEYGAGSEEVRAANERLRDAQERVRVAEEGVRMQVEMSILAWQMLIFGTVPTVLRAATAITERFTDVWNSIMLNVAATEGKIITDWKQVGVLGVLKGMIHAVNAALITKLVLVSALTLGFMALSFAISQFFVQRQLRQFEERMRDMRKEFGLTEQALTGRSLVEAIQVTTEAFRELVGVERVALRPGEVARLGAYVNVRTLNVGQINVIATVRREEDIRRIRRELEDLFLRGYIGRGGPL